MPAEDRRPCWRSCDLWARANGPARMMVEFSTTESFADSCAVRALAALENTDYTAKIDLAGLPLGQKIHYRVIMVDCRQFLDPAGGQAEHSFRLVRGHLRPRLGTNLDWGGMKCYETMRQVEPAFFIHSGDTIYADGPILAEQEMPNGEF